MVISLTIAKFLSIHLGDIFRGLSLQSGIGLETTKSLMENQPTNLVLATKRQTRLILPFSSIPKMPLFFFMLLISFKFYLFEKQDYALKVITETNESWAKLVKRSIPAGELSLL